MRTNPPQGLTIQVSITLTVLAVVSIWAGQFFIAALAGTTAAVNLIAGNLLKKY